MRLDRLIEILETTEDKPVLIGFGEGHCDRGYYHDLAFDPDMNTTVGQMLAHARKALDTTMNGWKGGTFRMEGWVTVRMGYDGVEGEEISELLMWYMLGEDGPPPLPKPYGA